MRIVHVVQGLGMGGQERLVLSLSRELASRGHESIVVALSPGGELRAHPGEGREVPVIEVSREDGVDASLVLRLVRTLREVRADVVHTHNPAPMIHAIPAALIAGVRRRIHTKHGANQYGPAGLWAARAIVRTLHAVVAVSPQTAAVARVKERVPERRLRVVLNGIPLDRFHPDADAGARVRRELGIDADAFVVGSVGRLAPEKQYPVLVRAIAPILSRSVRLVLVGDGDARRDIERSITPAMAPFVTLTGLRRDVPALLASFDLFALTSRTEGLPLAVPEAMASGLPVVATAVGGLPSVVPVHCGVLVASGDEDAIGRAIAGLAGDRDAARTMGRAGRRHALESFSIERTA
ncbi:MAG: glycosyltransferase, partial [Polyangiaceae bacterium]